MVLSHFETDRTDAKFERMVQPRGQDEFGVSSGRRVVLSGAAGFIGSHFCDRLLAEGFDVTGLDNLLTGSEANIAHLRGNPHFRFILHDVTTAA